uniref:CSON012314 protein n=1 Tax=Culicoides sonorensis TaxID=179676 RepID=A0A336KLD3_CULSO
MINETLSNIANSVIFNTQNNSQHPSAQQQQQQQQQQQSINFSSNNNKNQNNKSINLSKNNVNVQNHNNNASWSAGNKAGKSKGVKGKYFCDICGQTVSAISSIKRHKDAVHFKIKKKFKLRECPECGKSFFQLAKHLKIKHRDSKVKCTICERILSCSFSYKRHLKKVHGFFRDDESSQNQVPPEPVKLSNSSKDMDYSYPYSHNSSSGKRSSTSSNSSQQSAHSYQSPSAAYDPGMMLSRLMVDNTSPMDFKHDWMSYAPPFVPFKKPFPSDYSSATSSHSKSGNMMSSAFPHSAFGSPEGTAAAAALNSFYPTNYPFYPGATPTIDSQRSGSSSTTSTSTTANNKNEVVKDLSQLLGIEGTVEGSYIHPSQIGANTSSNNDNTSHNTNANNSSSGGGGTSNNNPNAVICTICNHSFRDSSSLRRHTKSKHASKFEQMETSKQQRKKYKCSVCNMHLSCSGSIQRHMRLMHNKVGDQPAQGQANPDCQYTCSVCQRSFMNEISLQRHFSYHRKSKEVPDGKSNTTTTNNTYNTCPPCDRGFENSWSYERHMYAPSVIYGLQQQCP